MKLLSLLTLLLAIGCRPEQAAVEYNITAPPVVGPNDTLELDEDTQIRFEYSIASTLEDENKHTKELSLVLHKQPQNGSLTDCQQVDAVTYSCLYSPNLNYSGSDEIEFKSKDGDFLSKEASKIFIQVNEVVDKPVVHNIQVSVLQGGSVEFDVPLATDPDSAAGQIYYEIIDEVGDGTLNCFKNANGQPQAGLRRCTYSAGNSFYGDTTATYKAKDHTGAYSDEAATITISVGRVQYTAEETFQQGQQSSLNGVDITWVVDNSGSMSDEQAALEQNFGSFIDNFLLDTDNDGVGDKAKFPFNMIVTSTEAYLSGKAKFRTPSGSSDPYDLSSTLAEANFTQFKSNFTAAALMGIGGNGSERSLASADALYLAKSDWYGGNDKLSVYIILSDEPEQSTSKTIAQWIAQFQGLKDDPAKTRFYPIIDPSKDNGNRYADLAVGTGGQVYNINLPFDEILNQISLTVTNLLNQFSLNPNREIVQNTLKVYIDDVQQASGWSFVNQSIKFDVDPPAGSTIRVTYSYYNL